MSIYSYTRVSTQEQARGGISLDDQRARLTAYTSMRGFSSDFTLFEDAGVSAAVPLAERPAGKRLLQAIALGGARAVVAVKLDRLFRDCVDCLSTAREWDEQGVALHLIDLGGQTLDTSSAMGRFFITIMSGAAELERSLICERTRAAMAHLKAQGVKIGRAGFGWRYGDDIQDVDEDGHRRVYPVVEEIAAARRAAQARAQGATLLEIAALLTAEGHKTKYGGVWRERSVTKALAAAKNFPEDPKP